MANRSDTDTTGIPAGHGDGRGSGSDLNSDTERLKDGDNLQDKIEEDTFPASDPPSYSPIIPGKPKYEDESEKSEETLDRSSTSHHASRVDESLRESGLPSDFKDNKAAQFEYGRKSQAATQHFDRSETRLRKGNPDIGEVDMGIIDADKPVAPDDDDPFDSPDDPDNRRSNKIFDERLDRSVQDTPDPADEY